MIELLTTIGAIFNPIGFALTALALYYAISTARKVERDMKLVQENMRDLHESIELSQQNMINMRERMKDMQKSIELSQQNMESMRERMKDMQKSIELFQQNMQKSIELSQQNMTRRMEDMKNELAELSDKSDVSDYTLRLTSPYPEPFISDCERIAIQYGFMEVRGTPFGGYGVTVKGKELLTQLYPANQLQHFGLQDKVADILKNEPEISDAKLLLSLDIAGLQDLTKRYNEEKGEELPLRSVLGTIAGFANEVKNTQK